MQINILLEFIYFLGNNTTVLPSTPSISKTFINSNTTIKTMPITTTMSTTPASDVDVTLPAILGGVGILSVAAIIVTVLILISRSKRKAIRLVLRINYF